MFNRRQSGANRSQHRAARAGDRDRAAAPMERLEQRVLLSGGTSNFKLAGPAGGIAPTSTDLADVKNGPMSNVANDLISLYRDYRRFRKAGGGDANYDAPLDDLFVFKGASVGVTVRGRAKVDTVVARLREAKAEIIYRNRTYNVIEAYVPIGQLHDLARDPLVAAIYPLYRFETKQMGSSGNQADLVQKTQEVRNNFGLTGSGVTVGVISDSANRFVQGLAGSMATGDLPQNSVEVLTDSPTADRSPFGPFFSPTDEGRAMLELIHDIAPGAALQFATSGFSQQVFADAIRLLRAAGSDIIVDDIGFSNEPAFQPGVLSQAITDVVDDGAVYLSAAGNEGNSGYEAPTNFVRLGRIRFVDWELGPQRDTNLRINNAGGTFQFWWDNPYNGVVGGATTDLDIYFYDTVYHRVIRAGTTNNIKTGVPMEIVSLPFGDYDVEIRVADQVEGTQLPTRFRIRGPGMESSEVEPAMRPTIDDHSGHEDTISVGAVPFFEPFANEDFSSFGPVTYMFDADGNRLGSLEMLQKPDLSGVDDTNTSFFGSDSFADDDVHPNFSGTSAAAPNVAALVALIREVAPDATQAEILNALKASALPLNGAGGGYDEQGGWGLVDAMGAIQQFVTPPTVDIKPVNPNPRTDPVDSIKIVFSQRVVGFDLSDLTLSRDGGPNLLTGAQTLQTTDNNRTFMLRELRDVTTTPGSYTLTLNSAGSGITNVTSLLQPLSAGTSESFTVLAFPDTPDTPSNLRAKVISDGVVRLTWSDTSDEEDFFVLQRADDEGFTIGVTSVRVPANTTTYTDEPIVPVGRRVFYRVRAVSDFSGFAGHSNIVEVFLPGRGEIILDNTSTRGVLINGPWQIENDADAFGGSALSDQNLFKGSSNVRYQPNITQAGEYFVYLRWTGDANRATNVPVDVVSADGRKQTFIVDQRNTGGDGWVVLGKFDFELGRGGFVRIRNDGTNGVVSADAVRFQPANGVT